MQSVGATLAIDPPMTQLIDEYAAKAEDELPIGGYAVIMGAFTLVFGGLLASASVRRALPERIAPSDIALAGVATHKLTRIITRDWVTIPIRFPFTAYEKNDGAGEVKEKSRGHGLRRAIGDLLTCSFCTGPWVAAALTAGLVARPRVTRVVASVFAMVTLSDFLHQLYARARKG
jgi:hypothetical protein